MGFSFAWKQRKRFTAFIDLLIIGVLGSAIYLIAVFTTAHELIDNWTGNRRFLGLELDELVVVFAFLGIAFSIFSIRRWNELHHETIKREESEKKLLEQENKFRDLVEKSLAGVYLVQNEIFRYVNPELANLFGYTANELIDRKGPADVVLPEDWPLVKENLQKRMSGEAGSIHYSFRGVKKNGEIIYVSVYGSRTLYHGRPAVIGTLLDITERKLKAEALRQNEERIIRQSCELEAMNVELMTLHKVTSAISHKLDRQSLFKNILNAITELDIIKVKRQAGIFIVEGDRLNLVAHLGHPKAFLDMHENMTVNDCLCGLAARTGEIVVCKDFHADRHHTIQYPGMESHGHIILPLKTADKVVGVLYLYLPPHAEVGESILTTLGTIGNQIGIAINNSMLYEETRELSLHDPLTGLANRRMMGIVFERSIARARRFGSSFSIIMLDLDNFKKYNDTHGHPEGDRLLVEVARMLSEEVRDLDLVARYGGEEFLILLPETDLKIACKVAERIRKSVETKTAITLSLGVTSCYPGIQSMKDFIKEADDALYQAKQKGKNRVEVAEPGLVGG
ncbi:MAG: diguanylate cyclase [Nitrospirae bacterium]|nr:diguanylate cyclase [Nitrospirota bacterium]